VSTRDYCTNVLDTLKLKGVSHALEQFPSDSEMSHLEFLRTCWRARSHIALSAA
jgi:hypothetical protein